MGFRKDVEAILANALGASKVVFKFGIPPVEITFEKSELAAMLRSPEIASRAVATCFVKRRLFWENLTAEIIGEVILSLEEVEPLLDGFDRELVGSSDLAAIGYARIVRAWGLQVVETRKELVRRIDEINKEKAGDPYYDSAASDRREAMDQALIALRTRVYPLVHNLLEMVDDTDPVKEKAIDKIDQGAELLAPRQIRELNSFEIVQP